MQGIKGMKVKKTVLHKNKCTKNNRAQAGSMHGLGFLTLCAICAVLTVLFAKGTDHGKNTEVYAASDAHKDQNFSSDEQTENSNLPTGIAGVVSGIQESPLPGTTINRIGSSCEQVMVGQRVQTVESSAVDLNVSSYMETTVNDFDSKAISMAENPKIMSDEDYDTLLRIVEAEAGGEDIKGRILVANVIMNRVKNEEFPNTVSEVVWEEDNGVPQFSPTYDGRINEVTVSDDTKEAVKQALNGVDYSEGALFFVQKSAAEKQNVVWFDEELEWLFRYGVHDFYKYPDGDSKAKEDKKENKEAKEDTKEELVQMEAADKEE